MNLLYIILFIELKSIFSNISLNDSFINKEFNSIDDAVYIIRFLNNALYIDFSDLELKKKEQNSKPYYIIKKIENISNENYYSIKPENSMGDLSFSDEKIIFSYDETNKNKTLWNIILKKNITENKVVYYVQNKYNKRFWEYNYNSLVLSKRTDINELNSINEFQFIRLFRKSDKYESEILKNEPIDVLTTYVDLRDKNYTSKFKRIPKDQDNQELRYSLRSILQNIPWINKIFILMPNEKVSFLKPVEEIKEKIVYVKDSDYLGFDSCSSPTLQFNLHKMKKFGLSENFILMDDDNFIGKPLEKSDFFYEENGKVYPNLVITEISEMDKEQLEFELKKLLSKYDGMTPHSANNFYVQQKRSLLLMYDIFGEDNQRKGKKLIMPSFTHNAISLKLSDIEELYEYVKKYYQYANDTLFGLTRSPNALQFQTTYMVYIKNKYDRKVSEVSSAFYDLRQWTLYKRNTKKLFVINTGLKIYPKSYFERETKIMNELFPNKTKYELDFEENITYNDDNLNKTSDNNKYKNKSITQSIDFVSINITNITNINITNNKTYNKNSSNINIYSGNINEKYIKVENSLVQETEKLINISMENKTKSVLNDSYSQAIYIINNATFSKNETLSNLNKRKNKKIKIVDILFFVFLIYKGFRKIFNENIDEI